tara:strand:- start:2539 stop:2718 length:180 start_codon:yes stop_codon:yes gene_type:complete
MKIKQAQELLQDAMQTDWEHGVAWMNEEAAAQFKSKYPQIWQAITDILDVEEQNADLPS